MKKLFILLMAAAVLTLGFGYALMGVVQFGIALHKQSAVNADLYIVFRDLQAYREANSQWPASLEAAAKRPGSVLEPGHFLTDPISKQRFIYYREPAGNKWHIILSQPAPIKVEFWPFSMQWREGIADNGSVVNLSNVPLE